MPFEASVALSLGKLGVSVEIRPPKRKDNLPGFMFCIPTTENAVPKDIASILGDVMRKIHYFILI